MNVKLFSIGWLLASVIMMSTLQADDSAWKFYEHLELRQSTGKPLVKLAYGIKKKGYDGTVRWRVTNLTTLPLYNVSIGNKTYQLSDGRVIKKSGEGLTKPLRSGESETFLPDNPNPEDYLGNKPNPASLRGVNTESPAVKFSLARGESAVDWARHGKVSRPRR